jgi:hypothetical protein
VDVLTVFVVLYFVLDKHLEMCFAINSNDNAACAASPQNNKNMWELQVLYGPGYGSGNARIHWIRIRSDLKTWISAFLKSINRILSYGRGHSARSFHGHQTYIIQLLTAIMTSRDVVQQGSFLCKSANDVIMKGL